MSIVTTKEPQDEARKETPNEAQENALRGVVATLSALIKTVEPLVPRAAQLMKQAQDDINTRWQKTEDAA